MSILYLSSSFHYFSYLSVQKIIPDVNVVKILSSKISLTYLEVFHSLREQGARGFFEILKFGEYFRTHKFSGKFVVKMCRKSDFWSIAQ